MFFAMWLLKDFRTRLKLALLDGAAQGIPMGATPVEYLEICDFGDKGLCGKEPPIVEKWPFLLTLADIYRALTRCQVFFMG